MRFQGQFGRVRGAAVVGVLMAAFLAGASPAWASAGCDAVNAGGFDDSIAIIGSVSTRQISGFAVGDTIEFTLTISGGPSAQRTWILRDGTSSQLDRLTTGVETTIVRTYSVTGNNQDTTLQQAISTIFNGRSIAITATCSRAPPALADLWRFVAETSGAAISSAIGNAIADAFDGGSGPVSGSPAGLAFNFTAEPQRDRVDDAYSVLEYAEPDKAAPTGQSIEQMWSAWADLRGTGWDGNGAFSGTGGKQVNLTAGIGRKLSPDFLLGIIGGYEHFDYSAASLSGTLDGDGGSAGAYLGWRFRDGLRLDASAVWSGIAYNATAGAASGSFGGSRWLLSGGLSGSHMIGAAVFEPSARIFAVWEDQTAWTDSAAVVHDAQSFSVGRGSLGGKLAFPLMTPAGVSVTPFLGAYGDYRFGSDTSSAGVSSVGIANGVFGRVISGVGVSHPKGATINLDGELGGFGSTYLIWTMNARAGLKF